MVRRIRPLLVALLAAGMWGCGSDRHSASGFRLPPDGDAGRGQAAFLALGCHNCHSVIGADLPRPSIQPPVPVVLGGTVSRPVADGFLVTSIIYPSYELGRFPKQQVTAGGRSRMPEYADRITVRQMADLVEFLQAHYTVEKAPPPFPYH
jgi:mono/diheme cytochrome c family protein